MCHNYNKHFLLSLLTLATAFSATAQADFTTKKGENRPYSKYGIGELRGSSNVLMRSMATISSAYANPFAVNTDNPASYALLKLTTFEGGAEGSSKTLLSGDERFSAGQVAVAYMDIGIPTSKNSGIAFGLRPYSQVYYSFNDTVAPRNGLNTTVANNQGLGSVNYAYLGAGGRFRGVSVGFNFGYLFGTIDQSQVLVQLADSPKFQQSVFGKTTRVGGLYAKFGAMYDTRINPNLGMRVGGTAALNQDVRTFRDQVWYSATTHFGQDIIRDTVFKEDGKRGQITLPFMYSFGVHLFGTDKWMVGVDYSGGLWSQFGNFEGVDSTDDSYRAAIGGEYTPNLASIHNYFQRVTYRAGFYYGRDFVSLRNTDINYYAVTFGASFPFRRSPDRFHVAFEIGNRGTTANNLVREKFAKLSLGVSLNDKWFIKRKYE